MLVTFKCVKECEVNRHEKNQFKMLLQSTFFLLKKEKVQKIFLVTISDNPKIIKVSGQCKEHDLVVPEASPSHNVGEIC